jgi:hypothetical protein
LRLQLDRRRRRGARRGVIYFLSAQQRKPVE